MEIKVIMTDGTTHVMPASNKEYIERLLEGKFESIEEVDEVSKQPLLDEPTGSPKESKKVTEAPKRGRGKKK